MIRPVIVTLSLLTLTACGQLAPSVQPFAPALAPVRSLVATRPASQTADPASAIKAAYTSTHTMPTHVGSKTTTTSIANIVVTPNGQNGVVAFTGRLVINWSSHSFDGPDQHGSNAFLVSGTYDPADGSLQETGRTPV